MAIKSTMEIIRECIEKRGLSRYEISKRTGVSQTALHRVVNGGDLMTDSADKLLELFGYEVRLRKPACKLRVKK